MICAQVFLSVTSSVCCTSTERKRRTIALVHSGRLVRTRAESLGLFGCTKENISTSISDRACEVFATKYLRKYVVNDSIFSTSAFCIENVTHLCCNIVTARKAVSSTPLIAKCGYTRRPHDAAMSRFDTTACSIRRHTHTHRHTAQQALYCITQPMGDFGGTPFRARQKLDLTRVRTTDWGVLELISVLGLANAGTDMERAPRHSAGGWIH